MRCRCAWRFTPHPGLAILIPNRPREVVQLAPHPRTTGRWIPSRGRLTVSASPEQSPVPANADELWEKTLALLREDGKSYALTWLDRMQALQVRDGALVLGVPDRFFRDWVDDHYRPLLEDALARVHGSVMEIGYEVVGTPSADASAPAATSGRAPTSVPRPPRLNERFTFANYVVAESNQLPAAAAAAVA